jgi:N-acetylglucosamine kinase-like BadF-type ATPase
MAERVYVGVDGGTSRSEVFVSDLAGSRTGAVVSGPVNSGSANGPHADAPAGLAVAVLQALGRAGLDPARCELRVWLALSGAPDWLNPQLVDRWWSDTGLREATAGIETVGMEDDHRAAWAAALFPDPCVWLLLGTYWGSRAIRAGVEIAHPLDDNGLDVLTAARAEPYWLGNAALALTVETLIRNERTVFTDAVLDELAVSDLESLLDWSRRHDGSNDRARLLPLLGRLAGDGERTAAGLLEDAGGQLAAATATMIRYLGLVNAPVTGVLSGNAWRVGAPLVDPFLDALSALSPQARTVVSMLSQAQGAALLGLRADGVEARPGWAVGARSATPVSFSPDSGS